MSLPPLDLGRLRAPQAARLRAHRSPGSDPLTGHRGAPDADCVVADVGPVTLLARVARDDRGMALRAQLVPPPGVPVLGAIVHVRGSEASSLGVADSRGEVVVRGFAGTLEHLDVEFEEAAFRLAWPAGP